MPFTAKTEYGLVALIDLAESYASGSLVQSGEICQRHRIPERYLEQMLTSLRKGGLLRSIRGPRGGFQLIRDPASITVSEVVACLEGEASQAQRSAPRDAEFSVLAALDVRAEQARLTVLSNTSLADLLRERESLESPLPMFYI
jgi:Rrf2 family cysteine metabolism transcriptional repressor